MNFNGTHLKTFDFNVTNNGVYVKKTIARDKPGMLLIYADWCGHCQRFKPVFNQIHGKIGSSFNCLSINDEQLSKDPRLSRALNFKGFPTIKFFDQNGKITHDYNGNRESSQILDHICQFYHKCY